MGKFNRDLAKKVSLETVNDNGPSDSQGIEKKSPGKMHWFTIKGESLDDVIEIDTTDLFDPDGDIQTYLIQAEDKGLREKIFNKADDNIQKRLLVRCQNWFGTEFLWCPSLTTKVGKDSALKAIVAGQNNNWIKCKWKSNAVGWQSWKHPGTTKIAEWSKMEDDEIIDIVFDGQIITSLDHEALIRNAGGSV